MNESTMIAEMKSYRELLQTVFETSNGDLRKVSQFSYKHREQFKHMPYLCIDTMDKTTNKVTLIQVAPTASQKSAKEFFSMKAEGSRVLTKYTLRGDVRGIHLCIRVDKELKDL